MKSIILFYYSLLIFTIKFSWDTFNVIEYLSSINLVIVLLVWLLISIIYFSITRKDAVHYEYASLFSSMISQLLAFSLYLSYSQSNLQVQQIRLFTLPGFNIHYSLYLDGIALAFIVLTTLLIPICIVVSLVSVTQNFRQFIVILLVVEFLLINVFSVSDLFFFYIFFESVLIPMFVIIGIWGARSRKIHAAFMFFLFTLVGSIWMLLSIIQVYSLNGTSDIVLLSGTYNLNVEAQFILSLGFFASFLVKVPMFPFHTWLPEAHTEAPTAGSVLLAGILLKLGVYGLIRIAYPLFPVAMINYQQILYVMCIISIIYASLTTLFQTDLKKIIAYSSVAHMNFALLGLFSYTSIGILGCLFYMIAHGIVSSALFICVGMLYERFHSRNLLYYGGLTLLMPLFCTFFFIFTLANLGLPGLVNFVGEYLVVVAGFGDNATVMTIASCGIVLGTVYSIWLYNRTSYGPLKPHILEKFRDLTWREYFLLLILAVLSIILGILPNIILQIL